MAAKAACGNGFPLNIPSEIPTNGGGGTGDYADLTNKPKINDVTLSGNVSLSDIGAASADDLSDIEDLIPSDASTSNKLATADDIPGVATANSPGIVQPDGTTITILNEVISAVGETYSTTETVIGTWEGPTLYRRVYNLGSLPNNTSAIIDVDFPSNAIAKTIRFIAVNNAGAIRPLPYYAGDMSYYVNAYFNYLEKKVYIYTKDDWSSSNGVMIVEYMKTA